MHLLKWAWGLGSRFLGSFQLLHSFAHLGVTIGPTLMDKDRDVFKGLVWAFPLAPQTQAGKSGQVGMPGAFFRSRVVCGALRGSRSGG